LLMNQRDDRLSPIDRDLMSTTGEQVKQHPPIPTFSCDIAQLSAHPVERSNPEAVSVRGEGLGRSLLARGVNS
jgi:hypothetical protein